MTKSSEGTQLPLILKISPSLDPLPIPRKIDNVLSIKVTDIVEGGEDFLSTNPVDMVGDDGKHFSIPRLLSSFSQRQASQKAWPSLANSISSTKKDKRGSMKAKKVPLLHDSEKERVIVLIFLLHWQSPILPL